MEIYVEGSRPLGGPSANAVSIMTVYISLRILDKELEMTKSSFSGI
jgi:hypothetical protein